MRQRPEHRKAAAVVAAAVPRRRAGRSAGLVLLLGVLAVPACTPPELLSLRSGLDSLRSVVDTLNVRDSVAFRLLQDTRREVAEQRDILLSTRATTGSSTRELFDQMGRLEGKLDEVMGRFTQITQRAPVDQPGGETVNQLFDQASQDLAQGRYPLALQAFRELTLRYPATELSDNAQYGIGECYFAQSAFDSAAIEYARVDSLHPQGDKVPAALYKLALSQEKLGRTSEAKQTFEALVRRYPLSGEAQLARERLGTARGR